MAARACCDRGRGILGLQGAIGQGELGPLPGPQHLPLAALPGLEASCLRARSAHRPGGPTATSRWAYSTARSSRPSVSSARLLQPAQPELDRGADPLEQLVALEQQLGVAGRQVSARSYAAVAASASC